MHYRLGFSSKLENPSVYIECSVRKPGIRHPVREIVKRFGKKKDLLAQDPLALEKIRQEVDEMNRNCKGRQLVSSPSSLKTLSADLSELLEQQSLDGQAVFESRIAGCLILQRLYDQLRFDAKFDYIKKCSEFQYDLAKITKDLVLLRILNPASKRRSCLVGPRHYLGIDLDNLDHVYKSLDVLSEHKTDIIRYWNRQIGKEIPERNTSVCLYDITTYAFESTDADSLRDFGFSKDKKFNEVQVVMALATDKDGLPLDYGLYKGNQAEGATMVPFVDELKKKFNIKSFTVVADRGLNSKSNIDSLVKLGDNYVLSSKIRGASDDIKAQVLSEEGRIPMKKVNEDGEIIDYGWYKEIQTDGPIKYDTPQYVFEKPDGQKEKELEVKLNHEKTPSGKTVKSKLNRRYIITWTASRARKDKKDRERLVNCVWKTWAWETAIEQVREVSAEEYAAVPIRTGHPQNEVRLIDVLLRPEVLVFEPLWTVIPGNKAILPVLWSLFPHHRYLLDTDFEVNDELAKTGYAVKPISGRCGNNIDLIGPQDELLDKTSGQFVDRKNIYQQLWCLPKVDGKYIQVCTFTVGGNYGGTCLRGDSSLVVKKESDIEPLIVLKDKA